MVEKKGVRVLVVEDERTIRTILVRFITKRFSQYGVQLKVAEEMAGGLKILKEEGFVPDLVYLNHNLPDGTGEQVAAAARGANPDCWIVGISNMHQEYVDARAPKPIDFDYALRFLEYLISGEDPAANPPSD